MLWRALRLYLDPFARLKSVATDPDALAWNRRHRGLLLDYVRRWGVIALVLVGALGPLAALARVQPAVVVPVGALELGFCGAVCMVLLTIGVYVVLGMDD